MHGRVKVRTTAEQDALKKKERAEKLKKYRAGMAIVLQKRQEKIYDEEILLVTERMLLQNPDINTLWNIRREAFINNNWNPEVSEEFLKKELTLAENCLRENPKSYCVWHQRTWIMDHMTQPDWKRELMLCGKCLDLDDRNFHCWDYRQFVVQRAGVLPKEELDFSTSKILNNFSNYSSWHYRSLMLSKIFKDVDETVINETKKEELDLVLNATFTDPNDSSAWFYQRWLLDNVKSSVELTRALISKNNAILSFDQAVPATSICLLVNNIQLEVDWVSPRKTKFSKLWYSVLSDSLENATEVAVKIEGQSYSLQLNDKSWIYKKNRKKEENYNQEQLNEQLSSYKELAKMEPNNKWALLTGVLLMRKIDPIKLSNDINSNLIALVKVDALRENYYKDLRSECLLKCEIEKLRDKEDNSEISDCINLSCLGLTTISNGEEFAFFKEVNLSGNNLSTALHCLSCFQNCRSLSLSSNQLKSLSHFPTLKNLNVLSLRNNELTNMQEILDLIKRHNLSSIDLRDNPIFENSEEELIDLVAQLNLKVTVHRVHE